jgi:hypothetical protein
MIHFSGFSQMSKFWRKKKTEYVVGIGASNFLGDLGGADTWGNNFYKDLELATTRPAIFAGYRLKFAPEFALKANLAFATLRGSDNLTKEEYRQYRNLSFRTNVYEFMIQAEYYFWKEKKGGMYNARLSRGISSTYFNAYFFGGGGVFFFNPKAKYEGKWYALQPLGTEGQGVKPGTEKYSRISFSLPVGIGINYAIDKNYSIGFEFGFRKTFSDYLDDVSTDYYDKEAIRAKYGDVAAALSDPSNGEHPNWTIEGEQRGDPGDKDSYMIAAFTFNYKINKRRNRAKF